eukprot:3206250-Rhodomonas_salina.1
MDHPVQTMVCFAMCYVTTVAAFQPTPALFAQPTSCFGAGCRAVRGLRASTALRLRMNDQGPNEQVDYNNKVIEMFGGMLKSTDLDQIEWKAPKREGLSLTEVHFHPGPGFWGACWNWPRQTLTMSAP